MGSWSSGQVSGHQVGVGELLHDLGLLEERLGGHRVRLQRLHRHLHLAHLFVVLQVLYFGIALFLIFFVPHLALPGALVDLAEVAGAEFAMEGDLRLGDLVLVPGAGCLVVANQTMHKPTTPHHTKVHHITPHTPGGILQGVAPALLGRGLGAGLGQLAAQALAVVVVIVVMVILLMVVVEVVMGFVVNIFCIFWWLALPCIGWSGNP